MSVKLTESASYNKNLDLLEKMGIPTLPWTTLKSVPALVETIYYNFDVEGLGHQKIDKSYLQGPLL